MSVTFAIAANPTGSLVYTCYAGDKPTASAPAPSYAAVVLERAVHMLQCDECQSHGCYVEPVWDVSSEFDVDASDTNAATLLTALGLPTLDEDGHEDLAGSADGIDFLGRVLLAMAEDRDDSGVPVLTVGNWTDCGLRPGYFADRFGALHALATEAVRLGRDVLWS